MKTVGVNMEPVTTIGGVTILPDMSLEELEPARSAMLILTGGAGWEDGKHTEAVEKAKSFLAEGVPVAAICGATAGLARAGILDDIRHTRNALVYLQATNYQGAAFYQHEPAVTDGNVITAGATSPIEFAYHIFKKLGVYTAEVLDAVWSVQDRGPSVLFCAAKTRYLVGRSSLDGWSSRCVRPFGFAQGMLSPHTAPQPTGCCHTCACTQAQVSAPQQLNSCQEPALNEVKASSGQ